MSVVSAELLRDLQRQAALLAEDLRGQAESDPELAERLRRMHSTAGSLGRTGETWNDWLTAQCAQAASSWVIACAFVRFCEDNDLTGNRWIASRDPDGNATSDAADAEAAWIQANPRLSAREWLRDSFTWLRSTRAGHALFPDTDFIWWWNLSADGAEALIAAFRRRDPDGVRLAHDFQTDTLDTRFLGDLYQDLSEHIRKRYALLQTPVFVEKFILQRTLDKALEVCSLDEMKVIDPTCGSGHFLLGAFERLLEVWVDELPGLDPWVRVQKVLDSIAGVDINSTAVAITKFRLMVAAMRACETRRLDDPEVPALNLIVATGDSLQYAGGREYGGGRQTEINVEKDSEDLYYLYDWEDIDRFPGILDFGRYPVVVGNPPYITVKDKVLNQRYRKLYPTCHMKYAFSVPFAELFFRLAVKDNERPGYVGQITANSFMKREFGKKLIEEFFRWQVDLTEVIDTSGAYIPGHGTPTVILIGKNRDRNRLSTIRTVLGVRGEPSRPDDPAKGKVWRSIIDHIDDDEFENEHITVTSSLPRERLADHPWSLSGGGADSLKELIDGAGSVSLGDFADSVGITCFTLEDDVFVLPSRYPRRKGIEQAFLRPMILGDGIRDWHVDAPETSVFPYDHDFRPVEVKSYHSMHLHLWPFRVNLANNVMFGQKTKIQAGLRWSEFGRLTATKLRTPLSITFAEVATHNHFVLDRGRKLFKQTAPVIKLPEGMSEESHLRLLGLLNSSTACFWLKQVSHNKGSTVDKAGARQTTVAWENFYQFNSTKVGTFPLPARDPSVELVQRLDILARELSSVLPSAVCAEAVPSRKSLADAERRYDAIRAEMIAVQEELDWEVYRLYGIVDEDLTYPGDDLPGLTVGERAFEIVLGKKLLDDGEDTQWFERHRSRPIREVPSHWPEAYRALVQRRIEIIENKPLIDLVERPECKRRWAAEPYEKMRREALQAWLLDRVEARELWFDGGTPRTLSVAQLADLVSLDADFRKVLDLYTGQVGSDPTTELIGLLKDEQVPYLAAMRYKDSGMLKREDWESVWALQRQEDAGTLDLKTEIRVPPKYAPKDFATASYWKHRGKLDVPKERFIGYLGAEREGDVTPVYGWAGWNHLQQATALANLLIDRGYPAGDPRVVPLLAGIAELEPWLHQWHAAYDDLYAGSPADYFTGWLESQLTEHELTRQVLRSWRPAAKKSTKQRGN
ncbi:BREX-2 system adenine-specific DNA-methyltransferase PglX [Nonomuraea sp. NPDC046802]|uniref:BREX-2 system adenine-specific DNA-methyltransferase PglX n=1 Tax=Nonomuraea sp. NPDC046802 TaxID=3154919 RepID=UPI0033C68A00